MLWLQTDGTVWNKGRTSQGTSKAMQWSHFTGQEWPSGDLEPQNSLLWSLMAIWDPLGALWHTRMAFPDPRNCSNASPGICPDLFHPCSILFHQLGATRSAYGPKKRFWLFWTLWGPSGTPRWPSLTRETVSMHHQGYARPCSTLVPLCFTSLEPLDPLMAEKGRFWLFWTLFGGPLAHPYGPP